MKTLNSVVPAYSLYEANVLLDRFFPHFLVFASVN